MKTYKKSFGTFLICILIPLVVGGISGLLTNQSMNIFQMLRKPPLSPPGWLFPVVWTILYILMGIALYLILTTARNQEHRNAAMTLFILQLAVNFLWTIFFFNCGWYFFSFFWLLILWALILATFVVFLQVSHAAGFLMIPYLLWVSFAGYLNITIAILN